MKMKCGKRIIGICVIVGVVLIAYIVRFRYLNNQFPKQSLHIAKAGESVEKNGLKYTVLSGEIMNGKSFEDKYKDESFADDAMLMVVNISVENTTNQKQDMGLSGMSVIRGLWTNGVEYYSLWSLNGDSFDDKIAKGKKSNVAVAVILNDELESIEKQGKEWRLRISDWPDRTELVIPMNGGEK